MQFFSIRAIKFDDESREDPFYFERNATRIAKNYIPFSGTITKRRYILFRHYVDWIIDNKKLPDSTDRDIRLRLEKLLVYCWSVRFKYKRNGIIGSTKEANPFTSSRSDWVKQNCYSRYTRENVELILEHKKDRIFEHFEKQFAIEKSLLQNFMRTSDKSADWKRKLDKMFFEKTHKSKKFAKSLFRPKLHTGLSTIVLECVKKTIKKANDDKDNKISTALKTFNSKKISKIIEPGCDNDFIRYDNEIKRYIIYVEKQLNSSANIDWTQFKEVGRTPIRPKDDWFILEDDIYKKKSEPWDFEDDWKKMVKKAKRKDKMYFDFRVPSLISLIKDDDNG